MMAKEKPLSVFSKLMDRVIRSLRLLLGYEIVHRSSSYMSLTSSVRRVEDFGVAVTEQRILPSFNQIYIASSVFADVKVIVDTAPRLPPTPQSPLDPSPLGGYRIPSPTPNEVTEGPFMVTIKGDGNLVPLVVAEVRKGKLEIYTRSGVFFSTSSPLRISVKTTEIQYVEHGGSDQLWITGVRSSRLCLKQSGLGDLVVNGTATEVQAENSGHGNTVIGPLENAQMLKLSTSGLGKLTVKGTAHTVNARFQGHGNVDLGDLKANTINFCAEGLGDVLLNGKTIKGFHGHGNVRIKKRRGASVSCDVETRGLGHLSYVHHGSVSR